MLPSNKKAHFEDIVLTPDTKKLLIFQHQNCTEVAQHLYITSDEEIKVDDHVIVPMLDGEFVAALVVDISKTGYAIFGNYAKVLDLGCKVSECRKIIATTDVLSIYKANIEIGLFIPKLSKKFIEAYIKAYNKGNIITDVAVEYENTVRNRFGEVHIQTINDGEEYIKTTILISSILKINPDNTINIKQSKDSWNRSEVVELCTKAVIYGFEHSDEDNNGNYDDRDNNETLLDMFVENFIKENL